MKQSALILGALAGLTLAACGGGSATGGGPSPASSTAIDPGSGTLTGAGATFPEPFYTRAFFEYNQRFPKVTVNYQAIGSGGGIKQFSENTVDFGASDVPMTASEVAAAGGSGALIQIPTILGVVAVAYNVSGVDSLNLDGPTLASIYLGAIRRWDDPAIKALNPGARLPATNITPVHRSDASGTSYIFTDYLSKVSPDFKGKVGNAKSVNWPGGVGAPKNDGVANAVQQTEGAIGYVELAYVVQARMKAASLKNKSGKLVAPSIDGATAAAATLPDLSPTNFSITDAPGDTAYPISGFSWALIRTSYSDAQKGRAVVMLFKWLVTDGQQYGKPLQYAALPRPAQDYGIAQLKTVRVAGQPVLS